MTRTAASNVQVLAAGTRQDQGKPESDSKTANASTVVTLLVSPTDAERIALAQAEGEIMLMLRNPLDGEATVSSGVKTASLLGTDEAPAPVVKAPAPRRAPAPVATSSKPVEPEQPDHMVAGSGIQHHAYPDSTGAGTNAGHPAGILDRHVRHHIIEKIGWNVCIGTTAGHRG
jgi:hypothetical protein